MDRLEFNLLGKDYLTEAEAAHYACVSESQFRAKAREYGILAVRFMGKKVFRKTDIQRAIENEWQRSPFAAGSGFSTGRRTGRGTAKASVA